MQSAWIKPTAFSTRWRYDFSICRLLNILMFINWKNYNLKMKEMCINPELGWAAVTENKQKELRMKNLK